MARKHLQKFILLLKTVRFFACLLFSTHFHQKTRFCPFVNPLFVTLEPVGPLKKQIFFFFLKFLQWTFATYDKILHTTPKPTGLTPLEVGGSG